ncbi:MAG: hypothetical protein ACI9CQ_004287 [Saprospiraceae bacterium]
MCFSIFFCMMYCLMIIKGKKVRKFGESFVFLGVDFHVGG